MSDLWQCDLNRADGSAAKARAGGLMVELQGMGVLVPVEPERIIGADGLTYLAYGIHRAYGEDNDN